MRRISRAVGLTVAVLAAWAVMALPAGAGTADDEAQFVSMINSLRASKGLAPLQVDAELTSIARRWAGSMADAGNISHNPNFAGWVTQDWVKLGENVGVGPDVPGLHQAFVNSPSHYRNLVDGEFTRIGVGVVRGADGMIYTAHQFMRLRSDSGAVSAPAPAPDPVVAPAPAPAPPPAPVADVVAPAATPSTGTTGSAAGTSGGSDASDEASAPLRAVEPPPALDHALTGLRSLDAAA
jgi:hypothetical protein